MNIDVFGCRVEMNMSQQMLKTYGGNTLVVISRCAPSSERISRQKVGSGPPRSRPIRRLECVPRLRRDAWLDEGRDIKERIACCQRDLQLGISGTVRACLRMCATPLDVDTERGAVDEVLSRGLDPCDSEIPRGLVPCGGAGPPSAGAGGGLEIPRGLVPCGGAGPPSAGAGGGLDLMAPWGSAPPK